MALQVGVVVFQHARHRDAGRDEVRGVRKHHRGPVVGAPEEGLSVVRLLYSALDVKLSQIQLLPLGNVAGEGYLLVRSLLRWHLHGASLAPEAPGGKGPGKVEALNLQNRALFRLVDVQGVVGLLHDVVFREHVHAVDGVDGAGLPGHRHGVVLVHSLHFAVQLAKLVVGHSCVVVLREVVEAVVREHPRGLRGHLPRKHDVRRGELLQTHRPRPHLHLVDVPYKVQPELKQARARGGESRELARAGSAPVAKHGVVVHVEGGGGAVRHKNHVVPHVGLGEVHVRLVG
mmetsp:Transcript_48658/g.93070  ORF Transcript_48658/g.93070 Transcript_48658/m.93070 type:complete len:288 (+) Transcript_48658:6955-7818(+)